MALGNCTTNQELYVVQFIDSTFDFDYKLIYFRSCTVENVPLIGGMEAGQVGAEKGNISLNKAY